MGNCVTVYTNKDPATMNLSGQFQSPTKENHVRREPSIAEFDSRTPQPSSMEQGASFRDLSKIEESFFDSQPWLESDCEDFFSVNGDSTSSSGNSPNHQKSFRESSLHDKNDSMALAEDAVLSAQSPTDTKKQLIELFRESFDDDDDDALNNDPILKEHKPTIFNLPRMSSITSPYEPIPNTARSSEATPPYRGYLPRKEKPAQSARCCLPSLVRNMSFGERKKRLSRAQN